MSNYIKLFKKEVPQFLVAWDEVVRKGFFTLLNVTLQAMSEDDAAIHLNIVAMAKVPIIELSRQKGITPYCDPKVLLAGLQHHFEAGEFILAGLRCNVQSEIWSLYNKKDKLEKIQGKNLELILYVYLERKKKSRKKLKIKQLQKYKGKQNAKY